MRVDERGARDSGLSLIEVVVAMALFGVLSTVLLGFVISTSRVTQHGERLAALDEESRLALERLARELRQAEELLDVQLPNEPGGPTSLTFWTDFNGNGGQDLGSADPEVLTYRWSPTTERLTLTANDASGTALTRPVLAGSVSRFTVELRSSLWQYDADADGVTTWAELDAAAAFGNGNGVPDDELAGIDLVAVTLTVTDGASTQTYTTEVDLRNRNQS